MAAKPDPYATTEALIANAITTARVLGENARITGLVASSIGRFAAELDAAAEGVIGDTPAAESPGRALLQFALSHIDADAAAIVPRLHRGLSALLVEAPPLLRVPQSSLAST